MVKVMDYLGISCQSSPVRQHSTPWLKPPPHRAPPHPTRKQSAASPLCGAEGSPESRAYDGGAGGRGPGPPSYRLSGLPALLPAPQSAHPSSQDLDAEARLKLPCSCVEDMRHLTCDPTGSLSDL